jgi:hypothetical protein
MISLSHFLNLIDLYGGPSHDIVSTPSVFFGMLASSPYFRLVSIWGVHHIFLVIYFYFVLHNPHLVEFSYLRHKSGTLWMPVPPQVLHLIVFIPLQTSHTSNDVKVIAGGWGGTFILPVPLQLLQGT